LIYARRQALAFYLWDHLSDPTQQKNAFLHVALKAYHLNLQGLLRDPEAHQERFEAFLEGEMEAAIRHEMGEALEPGLKSAFPALLERFSQTRVELWIRALKDVLAEVNDWGRLAYLIDHQSLPSLAVMLAWRPGLYPALLPELEPAFQELLATGDWTVVDAARRQALARLQRTAADLNALLDSPAAESTEWLQTEIHRRFLAPLGL
jgi:hypothetical protein